MKKHDEGYALVLVLVVVLVLNIAAMGLMTLTLNNLKTQRNLVDRMVDKYAAQGEIEKAVAKLSQEDTIDKDSEKKTRTQIEDWVKTQCGVSPTYSGEETDDAYTGTVILTYTYGQVTITSELYLSIKIEEQDEVEGFIPKTVYKITPEVSYHSYQYTSGGDS